jgi:FixJ family two-component response regulator
MFPVYHPTAVLLLDDDVSFLNSFEFYFGDRFTCRSFQRGGEALSCLETITQAGWAPTPYLLPATGAFDPTDLAPGDRVIQLKTSHFTQMFADPERFNRPTVAVVDFAMPSMSGIDFLKQIRDLPLRKVLLTGRADEKVAVDAFNDGIIDAFFMKHEPNLPVVLGQRLEQFQHEFFEERTRSLKAVLSLEQTQFLDDKAFDETFDAIAAQHGIIEHCVVTQPQGVLGLRSDGTPVFVHVVDDDYLRAACEIAREEGAPPELEQVLTSGNTITLFPSANGFYTPSFVDSWQRFCWSGTRVAGRRPWWYAVIEDSREVGISIDNVFAYDAFLARRASAPSGHNRSDDP